MDLTAEYSYLLDPTVEFEWELRQVRGELHRTLGIKALMNFPDYFFLVPASSSGKYHPKSSLGLGGLVRHVKSVFRIGAELLNHPTLYDFGDVIRDRILVALLVHDAAKQGLEATGTRTVFEHPILVINLLKEEDLSEEEWREWVAINHLVKTHMGPWNTYKDTKLVLEVPEDGAQKFVHMCDYLASRPILEVDTTERTAQNNHNKASEPAWRSDPVQSTQISYLKSLAAKADAAGIKVEPIRITDAEGKPLLNKGKASDLIQHLKGLLNLT